jgi:hypothetical protein
LCYSLSLEQGLLRMNALLHEDNTHKDIWIKLLLAVPVIIILAAALSFLGNTNTEDAVALFGIAALIVIIFSIIIPRQYLIFDDRVKIRFAGPLSFNIPFDTIKKVGTAGGASFGLNFPSSLSNSHAVGIHRKRRMTIYITPDDRALFMERLDKAINVWRKENNRSYSETA